MRVIKKSEVREIIIGHVELTLIFLFDDFLCKIAILEPLKDRFLENKQKLLSDDGSQNPGCNSRHAGLSSYHPGGNKKHQAKMQ